MVNWYTFMDQLDKWSEQTWWINSLAVVLIAVFIVCVILTIKGGE